MCPNYVAPLQQYKQYMHTNRAHTPRSGSRHIYSTPTQQRAQAHCTQADPHLFRSGSSERVRGECTDWKSRTCATDRGALGFQFWPLKTYCVYTFSPHPRLPTSLPHRRRTDRHLFRMQNERTNTRETLQTRKPRHGCSVKQSQTIEKNTCVK